MTERLYINGVSIPLLKSINPSLTFSVADISQPDKRKSTYSKTITLPNSKIANKLFGGVFEINLEDGSFDTSKKADMFYEVDGEIIMEGYMQMKSITTTDINDISYNVLLFGNTANLFANIKGEFLHDLDISEFNHPLVNEAIVQSWDYQILENGVPVPFELGKGYVYPLIDYGYSSDQITYDVEELSPAIYVKQYWDKIFEGAGATYTSNFLNSDLFKRLIIPSDPSIYALSSQDIEDRQFSVNTPFIVETGTTSSNNLPLDSYSSSKVVGFSNEVSDTGGVYNPVTGEYTVGSSGVYNLNTIVDLSGTFTPNNLSNNLKTTSEIRGKIQMILNGVTLVDEIDFYFSPVNSSVGVRSTSSTPTIPDPDYRPWQSEEIADVGFISRVVNPPNRYTLGVNGVTLPAGGVITVTYSAGLFKYDDANNYFQDSFPPHLAISGNANLNIAVGGFSNIAVNQSIGYGNPLDINRTIPKNYKQSDFLTDFIKMFNLQIEPDKLIRNNYIIEPYNDYYLSTKTNDWSEKHAINKPFTLTPTGRQKNQVYTYDYKKDNDYYNTLYNDTYQENYGSRRVEAINEFLKGTYKTEVTLSPTPIVGDPNGEIVIPRIIKLDDNQQAIPTKFNRRVLYYGGLKGNPNGGNLTTPWKLDWSTAVVPLNQYEYPYCGHFDDPFNATLDINFGLAKEVYYDDNISPITITTNNLYNAYHRDMMNAILDENGKVFEGMFNLTPTDIYTLSFRDLFYHNNAYWKLIKISNYNPTSDELVKCEFQKVVNLNIPPIITDHGVDGATDDIKEIDPDVSPANDKETSPVKNKSSNKQEDGNNYNPRTSKVTGSDNYVNRTSTNIEIFGDNNRVTANVDRVSLLNSNNNLIGSGVRNVTLINSDNMEITESNKTFLNGVELKPSNNFPVSVKTINADQDVELDVMTYNVNTKTSNVILSFDKTTTTFVEGQTWNFKKIELENDLIIRVVSGNIDGEASITINRNLYSITVQYDGSNFIII